MRKLAFAGDDLGALVFRVIAEDDSTSFSEEALSGSVFGNNADGNGADAVSLKSQYELCSHNMTRFQETQNRQGYSAGIENGTTTVTVTVATSEGDGVMRNAITAKLNEEFSVTRPDELAE